MPKKLIGYIAAVISTILLGGLGIFVRNIASNGSIITLARLVIGLGFLTFFLLFTKQMKKLKTAQFSFSLLITGSLLALTSLCYINAIIYTSLANAVFLLYLGPLLAVGLTAIFLKERFTIFSGGLVGLAFLGFLCLLEFRLSFTSQESKGYLWGMGAAVCYALYVLFNRKISKEISALTRSFYQLLVGTLTILPFLDTSIFKIPTQDIPWLIAIGFFHGFLAFSLIILALKNLKAVEYGTIAYLEPIVAALIGFILYTESLTLVQFIGCISVFLGGIIQVMTIKKTDDTESH